MKEVTIEKKGIYPPACERRMYFIETGARHDIYWNPSTGKKQPVPRHTEFDNALARHIRKYLGLK